MAEQLELHFGPWRNSGLFSAHWLKNRLPMEPEWDALQKEAEEFTSFLFDFWRVQKSRVAKYGSEATLEQAFIQPIFDKLGWTLKYQTQLDGRKPDYALFLSEADYDNALNVDSSSKEFWSFPRIVADAKAWDVSLDQRSGAQREYPPQQIEWYLDRSRLEFGILTNGRVWRLVPRQLQSHQQRFLTYFEFDLEKYFANWSGQLRTSLATEDALYFYLFFGPAGHRTSLADTSLISRAVEGSSAYRIGVGEDLRLRAFEAVRLSTEGLLSFPANRLNAAEHLAECRRHSFTLVYRLLFIMFAEDRGLLPYATHKEYRDNRSLSRHRDDVARQLDIVRSRPKTDFPLTTHHLLADLRSLFDLVDQGKRSYGVPAYNGGLFDRDSNRFLEENQISDWHLARIIDQLGRAADVAVKSGGLFRVDYRDLAIQHLGSIYEGLLELEPRVASVPMKVILKNSRDGSSERTIPAAQPCPEGYEDTGERYSVGEVFLETNKGERRASGSYYTPDHIVNHLVENTLEPLCQRIGQDLGEEIQATELLVAKGEESATARLAQLRGEYDDRVLRLRVLDPAMGSGHFLLRACGYLAEQIATHPLTAVDTLGDSSITYWKRRVSECCLYGVDLNGLAVELAKLALWLETVAVNRPLTFLDHHFRTGNSLVGARIAELGALPDEKGLFSKPFVRTLESKIPQLLKPLSEIEKLPSRDTSQVKAKERLLAELDTARLPFRHVADVWCSVFALPETERVHGEDYRRLIGEIKSADRFDQVLREPAFQQGLNAARSKFDCFHWELEFPGVFYAGKKRRDDSGFDVIIGNPPYDVLSELESGRDLAAFKAFIQREKTYRPSLRGKNNLYKLFVCRALDLLANDGYLALITPMAILGDDQAAEIRRALFSEGTFTLIEAFPQKDDRHRRVFEQAKLSTAAFVYQKCAPAQADNMVFTSRVHPGREIEPNSPQLRMRRAEVPLYDPKNCTLVSCSQEDLDLAVRIMQSGRLRRMGEVAKFFQGEVNETIQRKQGTISRWSDTRFHKLVSRGANVCLYRLRKASQGNDIYLDVPAFLSGSSEESKAFHHQQTRIGLQESCPQNNFRRIIAAFIPSGEFCNHTVNYSPQNACDVDLRVLLAVLNSKLTDWYFRMGSTNAHVSHYQLANLPFPCFHESSAKVHSGLVLKVTNALESRKSSVDAAFQLVAPLTKTAPFDPVLGEVMVAAVERIEAIELKRGEIARRERSALAPEAQRYQDFIDRLLFAMAGLSPQEAASLEDRLKRML